MDATITLQDGMYFTAMPDSGVVVPLESGPPEGQARRGASPMELLMISLAGCTAMDVVSILRKKRQNMTGFEIRIHKNMERILAVLERRNLKATFFCLGWIAERYPEVIRQIAELGHEVGSHTQFHQLAYEQSPREFAEDVGRSVKVLQDVTGGPIRCFRAPGFSIGEKNKWAFEILANLGIEIDSSIFPARRAHTRCRR